MRTGLWLSGSGGAGVLLGRLPDGSWSPPSGLMLHTVGLGFLAGIDIYDCVMIINTEEALQGFSKLRGTVGGEMSAVAGPVGMGAVLESEVHKRRAPIFTYLKSRGLYAGVQMDGTVLIERTDENERFYGEKIAVMDILQGKVRHPPPEINALLLTLRAAQGDDVDWGVVPDAPPPSDFEIETDHVFGVPDKMDPDPYGVLALEKEGMQLKEAGTNKRASHEAFVFAPSPSSPIFHSFNRNSIDGKSISRRSSWRTSVATTVAPTTTTSRPTSTMVDMAVQTDFDNNDAASVASPNSFGSNGHKKMADIAEDPTTLDPPAPTTASKPAIQTTTNGTYAANTETRRSLDNEESPYPEDNRRRKSSEQETRDHTDDEADEEPIVVSSVQTAAPPQFINRARLVSVKKPHAPALPPRNPVRAHGKGLSIGSTTDRTSEDSRPSAEHTRSHDSMTLVDLNGNGNGEKKDEVEVETPAREKDEFHSVVNSPQQSPRLGPVNGVEKVENEKPLAAAAQAQTAQA